MRVLIVCRNSMLLGGLSWLRADGLNATTARVRSPRNDGIWVYVAHDRDNALATPDTLPDGPWRLARMMRMGARRFAAIGVEGSIPVPGRHALWRVDDGHVREAVTQLRDWWQSPLPVRWLVQQSVPDHESLPCQWKTELAPEPAWTR